MNLKEILDAIWNCDHIKDGRYKAKWKNVNLERYLEMVKSWKVS